MLQLELLYCFVWQYVEMQPLWSYTAKCCSGYSNFLIPVIFVTHLMYLYHLQRIKIMKTWHAVGEKTGHQFYHHLKHITDNIVYDTAALFMHDQWQTVCVQLMLGILPSRMITSDANATVWSPRSLLKLLPLFNQMCLEVTDNTSLINLRQHLIQRRQRPISVWKMTDKPLHPIALILSQN